VLLSAVLAVADHEDIGPSALYYSGLAQLTKERKSNN
jgi:hypothetical protein